MPFKSQAQRRYLYAKHPEVAKEFAEKTSDIKSLPEYKESPIKKELKKRLRK